MRGQFGDDAGRNDVEMAPHTRCEVISEGMGGAFDTALCPAPSPQKPFT